MIECIKFIYENERCFSANFLFTIRHLRKWEACKVKKKNNIQWQITKKNLSNL